MNANLVGKITKCEFRHPHNTEMLELVTNGKAQEFWDTCRNPEWLIYWAKLTPANPRWKIDAIAKEHDNFIYALADRYIEEHGEAENIPPLELERVGKQITEHLLSLIRSKLVIPETE